MICHGRHVASRGGGTSSVKVRGQEHGGRAQYHMRSDENLTLFLVKLSVILASTLPLSIYESEDLKTRNPHSYFFNIAQKTETHLESRHRKQWQRHHNSVNHLAVSPMRIYEFKKVCPTVNLVLYRSNLSPTR